MASNEVVYESIGRTYSTTRLEDPRIAAAIHAALGNARSVVNVGAGTGNYEPRDLPVVAVEPSPTMLRQRSAERSALTVNGFAEALPFAAGAFDAAMAILTIHHWTDLTRGLQELRRVARRQVVLFFEPLSTHDFWALDYFPAALSLGTEQHAPGEAELREHLEVRSVDPVLVPRDCLDGFGAAFWCRPEAYADPAVQAGMSWLAQLPAADLEAGSARLRADLDSGEWVRRHGHLLDLDQYDGGYRIAVAGA
jgi:SAM-dependent methyltransferase